MIEALRVLVSILFLLAQVPPFARVFPPDGMQGEAGATPIPEETAVPCPCGTLALYTQSVTSCPGTINPSCNGAPDPYSMVLGCDPGGINPPGTLVLFVSNDGTNQCYGIFAHFLGEGLGYSQDFTTGGYVSMSDEETPACEALYAKAVSDGYCGP